MPEKWEYWTTFLYANINDEGVKEFISRKWPDWQAPKYTPQAMIPELNRFGDEGWELVHMEPVAKPGSNGDVHFPGEYSQYSNCYFCVFKRRKE